MERGEILFGLEAEPLVQYNETLEEKRARESLGRTKAVTSVDGHLGQEFYSVR